MNNLNKSALVVEGGAMRGIFSAGILDAFIKYEFNPFDICIGVSAGANNLTSFLANMYQRSYKIYTDYSLRKDFINWTRFLKGGHLLDLDWLWDTTLKEIPIEVDRIVNSKSKFYVGVTEVKTGRIKYLKPTVQNIKMVLKASSCIPIFYRDFIKLDDVYYVDGGIADPIPVKEAVNQGAKKILVLRSRPYSYTMKQKRKDFITHLMFTTHPKLKESIIKRHETYQESIDFIRNNKELKIIEVNPPETFKTKRLTKEFEILKNDYQIGFEIGERLVNQLNNQL